jgi:hypothetical protein
MATGCELRWSFPLDEERIACGALAPAVCLGARRMHGWVSEQGGQPIRGSSRAQHVPSDETAHRLRHPQAGSGWTDSVGVEPSLRTDSQCYTRALPWDAPLSNGEEEASSEVPISTRRASPTERPRRVSCEVPSCFLLPQQAFRGNALDGPSLSPCVRRAGKGRSVTEKTPRAISCASDPTKHTGTGGDRCPRMTARTSNLIAADRESTSRAGRFLLLSLRARAFGSQERPNHVRLGRSRRGV